MRTIGGTRGFQAPELLKLEDDGDVGDGSYTSAVDIWCIGEILFRALTGVQAFRSDNMLRRYEKCEVLFPLQALLQHGTSQDGSEFIEQLMGRNPHARLTAAQALSCPWVLAGDASSDEINLGEKDLFR